MISFLNKNPKTRQFTEKFYYLKITNIYKLGDKSESEKRDAEQSENHKGKTL